MSDTFKSSAISVLSNVGKPLHYKEITNKAITSGLLETNGKSPERTMNSVITTDIKTLGTSSSFVKISNGVFGLNNKIIQINIAPIIKLNEKIEIESSFVGSGGEFAVCSELLFRGFNASIMTVDTGIDICAVKDNKFFGIQVKTSRKNKNKTYNFHIKKTSFDKHNKDNTFYVLVFRDDESNKYIILSVKDIERYIKSNAIFSVNNNTGYAIAIKINGDVITLGNKNNIINHHLNKWDYIK